MGSNDGLVYFADPAASRIYKSDADGKVTATSIAPTPPIDVTSYASDEVFATAADGTKIPLSIIYKKGLRRDGQAVAPRVLG